MKKTTKKSSISTQAAKAKGRRLQQWVRDKILEVFPSLHPDDVKSTGMGQVGEDVQLSPAARKLIPVSIECKARAKVPYIYDWYSQAEANCPVGSEPVLVIRQDRKKALVVIDADTYFKEKSK